MLQYFIKTRSGLLPETSNLGPIFAAVTIFSPCNNNTILFTLLSSRNTAALTKLYTLIIIPQFADDSLVLYLNGISDAL